MSGEQKEVCVNKQILAHIRSHFGSSNFSSRAPSLALAAILVHWNVYWRQDGHVAANVPKGLCVAAPFCR